MVAPLPCGLGCRSLTDGRIHKSRFLCQDVFSYALIYALRCIGISQDVLKDVLQLEICNTFIKTSQDVLGDLLHDVIIIGRIVTFKLCF
jgi:hypothetical protein